MGVHFGARARGRRAIVLPFWLPGLLIVRGGKRRLPCLLDKHPRYLTCDTTLNPVPCYQPSPGSYHRKRERREAGAESTLNLKKKK